MRSFETSEGVERLLLPVLGVNVIKVEVVVQEWHSELRGDLSEGFSKADALSSHERGEGKWVTRLSIGAQVILTFFVEALRDELGWLDPLFWVSHYRLQG